MNLNGGDGDLFGHHLKQMLFIQNLQENENAFMRFSKQHGQIFKSGGGLSQAESGFRKDNNALPNGGFSKHHPALQAEMQADPTYTSSVVDGLPAMTATGSAPDYQETEFENKKTKPPAELTKISIEGEIKSLTGGGNASTQSVPMGEGKNGIHGAQIHALEAMMKGSAGKKAFSSNTTRHVILIKPDGDIYDLQSQARASASLGITKHALQGGKGKSPKNEFDHTNVKNHGMVVFVTAETKKTMQNLKQYAKTEEVF
jgi:hypothetical protein